MNVQLKNENTETVKTTWHGMTIEQHKQLVKEFRESIKNPDFKPYKCKKYGTKYKGQVKFIDYIFYALLRGADHKKTTHDVNSENYLYNINLLKSEADYVYKSIQKVIPSLTFSDFKKIVKNA